MYRKHFALATMLVLMFLSVAFVPLSGQQATTYDPWLDYNEDGIIDANELHPLAKAYGAQGEPTKNVNVTNFPLDPEGNLMVNVVNPPSLQARASVCAVLNTGDSYTGRTSWRGVDAASNSVTGIGGKPVRFVSGSVSGGGTQCIHYEVTYVSQASSERPACGWVEVKDSLGAVIAGISLPLNYPVLIENVDSFTIIVAVPYSLTEYKYFARQSYAVAGVTYEILV